MSLLDNKDVISDEQLECIRRVVRGESDIIDCTKPGDDIFWIENGKLMGRHMSIKERIERLRNLGPCSWDCDKTPEQMIADLIKLAEETGEEI